MSGSAARAAARRSSTAALADSADPAAAARAMLYLGLTHELAGDRNLARDVYGRGREKYPAAAKDFDAALDRLDATDPNAGKTSRLFTPADAAAMLAAAPEEKIVALAIDEVSNNTLCHCSL